MKPLALILLALIGGCGSVDRLPDSDSDQIQGYVRVDPGDYQWRAMSAQGVTVGLRAFSHDPAGSLDFWSTVVRKELEGARGYVFESDEAVGGGRAMLFATPSPKAECYWIVVWVSPSRIVTFEAGGPRADLARDLPLLKAYAAKLKV